MKRTSFVGLLAALGASATAVDAAQPAGVVTHVAIFRFAPVHVAQAVAAFETMRTASRRHPGNLAYDVFRSSEETGTFFILERWASAAALAAHEQTHVFATVGRGILTRYAELHDTVTGAALP